MCGRFSLSANPGILAEQFSLDLAGMYATVREMPPRYNIAPSQPVAVVRTRNVRGERELVLLLWGLVPGWAKDPAIGNRMINARAETVAEKPSFRSAFRHRRCLLLADGFYEWKKIPGGKQPYHMRREDDAPFAFAGLWEHWMGADGSEISSCAILTTAANERMSAIHARMPVILAPEDYAAWLNPTEGKNEDLLRLLAPGDWEGIRPVPVSAYVNNVRNEGPRCIEPLDGPDSASEGFALERG